MNNFIFHKVNQGEGLGILLVWVFMATMVLNIWKSSAPAPKKELLHAQIRKKTSVVDFLSFAVEAKLCLLLTSNFNLCTFIY